MLRTVVRRRLELNAPRWLYRQALKTFSVSPWDIVDPCSKILFVHIPRTGGGSISSVLRNGSGISHYSCAMYNAFDPDRFHSSWRFTFVRNPWSRLVSAYQWVKYDDNNKETIRFRQRNAKKLQSFEDFLKNFENPVFAEQIKAQPHFRCQSEWITLNGCLAVHFVGKLENIHADFAILKSKTGLFGELPWRNKSSSSNFRAYYNSSMIEIVRDFYRDDIMNFGYEFELASGHP